MADPLSIGASVLAFIGLADRIIRTCKHYIEAVEDAPRDIQMILGEATSLRAIIDSIGESSVMSLVPNLHEQNGPIKFCHSCLSSIEALLPPTMGQSRIGKRRKITLADLAWPLKQSKVRKLLAEISHHKATLLLAMSGDMSRDLKEIRMGIERLQGTISAFNKHEPLTTTWVTNSSQWKAWLSLTSETRLIWIHGLPGSGKTVLASYVIEELEMLCKPANGSVCSYYYCHYSHNQDETVPFLSWIIGHVCRQISWIPSELKRLHDHGCEPTTTDLEEILEIVVNKLDVLYIIIDAVDESTPREDLLLLIQTITVDKRFEKIRILATSRQYFDIEQSLTQISTSISMSNPMVDADIRRFVHSRLRSSNRLKRWHARFDEIEEVLAAMAEGMFRWAECQIQAIERLRDQSKLQQLLSNLPKDLSETYIRIFEAIPDEDRPLVRCILTWIIGHSQAAWVYHVGVNANLLLSAVTYEHFGSETKGQKSIIDLEYLKEICSCLITVRYVPGDIFDSWLEESPGLQAREATDGEDLYVSLAHYTVLEFLVSPHVCQPNFAFFAMSPELIRLKFAKSVLKQALAADPKGTSTDWIHDREAYCLTLGCALYLHDILAETDLQDLFMLYIHPSSPHYSRFEAIQSRIVQGDEGSRCYFLRHIPARIHCSTTEYTCSGTAATLMNILLLWSGSMHKELMPMIRRLLAGRQIQELLDTKVTVTFIEESEEELEEAGNGLCENTLDGAVWEIVQFHMLGRQLG
ncbi:Vegetative incompatibility protein HET-E-1 [Fusarium oxysporum f. sp. cubense race 1]|uniref:Vegetative incompatibility protein HET-E-1 n=1 Tax=Fusarium oxysporum f. sp. cubense (strain race 1) TaxID=1229664 RepID=N4UKF0_FUSC1|nr:Vegetative incompatibility protein HET-E-1 [Fusarium oxysporum f. sp. cubense race 1]